jgi:hypothetical protein
MPNIRPAIEVAVVMQRVRTSGPSSHWQPWRWELAEVVAQQDGFGTVPRLLYKNESGERWLHPGYKIELFKDEAEGYHLNASTEAPCWFVLWRMEEEAAISDVPIARPEMVSLSYYEAGRWLDAQETVEQVAAPAAVLEWLRAFVAEHPVEELKRRKRPESFRTLTDRFGQPASISTEKKAGADHG